MESPTAPADAPAVPVRRAVIDVGTNSVKLLVGDVLGQTVTPVHERGIQTRLGEGFYETRVLGREPLERTVDTVAAFRLEALQRGAVSIRVFATSAAREARNPEDLRSLIHDRAGLELEILSGATEADLAFRGACSQARLARGPILVTDLGGGSTEFIVGCDGIRRFGRSFPLGAVRLLEALRPPANPTIADRDRCRAYVDDYLRNQVLPEVGPALASVRRDGAGIRHVGVGGTALVLARMVNRIEDFDRDRIEATRPTLTELQGWVDLLWSRSLAERRQIPGLPPERADVILTGAVVHESILRVFGIPALEPSTRGLRFAALIEAPSAAEPSRVGVGAMSS